MILSTAAVVVEGECKGWWVGRSEKGACNDGRWYMYTLVSGCSAFIHRRTNKATCEQRRKTNCCYININSVRTNTLLECSSVLHRRRESRE